MLKTETSRVKVRGHRGEKGTLSTGCRIGAVFS